GAASRSATTSSTRAGWLPARCRTTSAAASASASSMHTQTSVSTAVRTGRTSSWPVRSISWCSLPSSALSACRLLTCAPRITTGSRDRAAALTGGARRGRRGDHVVRLLGTPAPRLVVGQRVACRRALAPAVEDGRAEAPGLVDLVDAGEEGGVAEHAVEQQPLVRLRRLGEEGAAVEEVHADAADAQRLARHLGAEAQGDALVGLDAQHQEVGVDAPVALLGHGGHVAAERRVGHLTELDGDLGGALGQAL